jgi:hypothetical protein
MSRGAWRCRRRAPAKRTTIVKVKMVTSFCSGRKEDWYYSIVREECVEANRGRTDNEQTNSGHSGRRRAPSEETPTGQV